MDTPTQDEEDWAYDRWRDEQTIDEFIEEQKTSKLFPDETNVY